MTEPVVKNPAPPEEPPRGSEEVFPRRFGKYTLLRKLAVGGMAELYLALHRSIAGFERLVVIKRILPKMSQDQGFITMLLQEARIAATFSHPNVVTIFDVGQVDGTYFIAMEHIHGEDLRSVVRAMKPKGLTEFPLGHALTIARDVAAGLAYAHEKQDLHGHSLHVVHRDVSPQNILVTFTGDVKVVDFGIAKASLARPGDRQPLTSSPPPPGEASPSEPQSPPATLSGEQEIHSTRAGQLKGKVPYMSPEQARGEDLDARSDVFSLGIILFELCTGRRLFRGSSEAETLKVITEGVYPRAGELNARISPRLDAIIARALAPSREDRYPSARDLQADLEAFLHEEHIPTSTVALGNWMQMLFADQLEAKRDTLTAGHVLPDFHTVEDPDEADEDHGVESRERPRSAPEVPAQPRLSVPAAGRSRSATMVVYALALALMAGVGWYIVGLRHGAAAARTAATVHTGTITVHSVPEGASVWLDDAPTPFRTPYTLTGLTTGPTARYHIRLAAEGYAPVTEDVSLPRAYARETVTVLLVRARAGGLAVLEVATTPPGATVLVDGTRVAGTTPLTVPGLAPGVEHTVLVRDPGHFDETFNVSAAAGQVESRAVMLRERPLGPDEAWLTVTTEPQSATVTYAGNTLTTGSPYRLRVPAGHPVQVVVSAAGYVSYTHTVRPSAGSSVALALVHLARQHHHSPSEGQGHPARTQGAPGRITVGAMPWCAVSIDGVSHGQTPAVGIALPAGSHTITCNNPTRGTQTRRITLSPGQDLRVRIEFP